MNSLESKLVNASNYKFESRCWRGFFNSDINPLHHEKNLVVWVPSWYGMKRGGGSSISLTPKKKTAMYLAF